jgi:HPt (histidine-containing phosphotransfer) domain-containing protein
MAEEHVADISPVFVETMVNEIGLERARACIDEFVTDTQSRCLRLHEMLPGWEADAIRRICHEISGVAGTVGAIGLADALTELSDAVARGDRAGAATLVARIETITRQLRPALGSCLQVIAVKRSGQGRHAV